MIKKISNEIKNNGITGLIIHLFSKITGNNQAFFLYKQHEYSKMNLEEVIEEVQNRYREAIGENLDLNNPISFTAKIQWMKIYDATPIKTQLSDKYLVRKYVQDKIGRQYLVPLLGVWDSFDQIDFNKLPNRFALKLNNGSGMNIVVKDKKSMNIKEAKEKFDFWMKTNYAFVNFEMQYRDIRQRIIAEEYIEQEDGNLFDYKFDCFNGKPLICELIGDRNLEKHTGHQAFLNMNWEKLDIDDGTYPFFDILPKKPDNWESLIDIAEKLSQGFSYVRVDLYSVSDKVYFGELTFTPSNGTQKWNYKSVDLKLGNLIKLPAPYSLPIPKN